MSDFAVEIRQAARRLRTSPMFSMAAVLTLALAIGANAAIFVVVHRVVMNPLPYGDSERLVALLYAMPSRNIPSIGTLTSRLYYHYRDNARTLEGIAVYRTEEATLSGGTTPERVRVTRAAPALTTVLRMSPLLGRWFTESEGTPGNDAVIVLSHNVWVSRYGGDPAVIGRAVTLDGLARTVIGVMPRGYLFPDPAVQMWVPLPLTPAAANDAFMFAAVGRLREGARVADARAELDRLGAELAAAHPGNGYDQLVATTVTLLEATVGQISRALWILLAAVGVVLLVACANVANLFLVRAEARQRELAVRRALGADRRAVAGYFMSESLLVSTAGGLVGLGVAWAATRLLLISAPANLPRLAEIALDARAVGFTAALTLLTALAFGLLPLGRSGRAAEVLHESGRGNTTGRRSHRARRVLMAGQMALALVLIVAAGLLLRSFQNLRAIDPGFEAGSALRFRVGLPPRDYPDRSRSLAAHAAMVARLGEVPGVRSVSAATCLPLVDGCNQAGPLFVEGRALPAGVNPPIVVIHGVLGGFFETMGMPLRVGRSITHADVDRSEAVVIVNEALARIAFGAEEAVGKRVRIGNPALSPFDWATIVGVVANTPTQGLVETSRVPKIYMPLSSLPEGNLALRTMDFVARTSVPPTAVLADVRAAVRDVDGSLALAQVGTLQDLLDRASAQAAFTMVLVGIAAAVALMLGLIGIYAATAYIVSQRTQEIGVRLALGATTRSVARMIVGQGGAVAGVGVAIGFAAALERTMAGVAAVRRQSPRSGRVCRDGRDLDGRGTHRLLVAGAPSLTTGSRAGDAGGLAPCFRTALHHFAPRKRTPSRRSPRRRSSRFPTRAAG